jgi:uncharacterized membrane protein
MQRVDLVYQARAYVNQAKHTISARKRVRLLTMAQRLLIMSAENTTGLIFVSPHEPQLLVQRRGR